MRVLDLHFLPFSAFLRLVCCQSFLEQLVHPLLQRLLFSFVGTERRVFGLSHHLPPALLLELISFLRPPSQLPLEECPCILLLVLEALPQCHGFSDSRGCRWSSSTEPSCEVGEATSRRERPLSHRENTSRGRGDSQREMPVAWRWVQELARCVHQAGGRIPQRPFALTELPAVRIAPLLASPAEQPCSPLLVLLFFPGCTSPGSARSIPPKLERCRSRLAPAHLCRS